MGLEINKERTVTISELIYNKLKTAIIEGDFKEGEKLSTENLSKMMKVSRMPLREAFRKLEANGLVRIQPQVGVIVSDISIKEFQEISRIRIILEREAMKILVENFEKIDFSEVKKLLHLEKETDDVKTKLKIRKDIHNKMYELTDNRILSDMIKELIDRFDRYLYLHLSNISEPEKYDHNGLLDVLKKGDSELAMETIEDHIQELCSEVIEILER